MAEAPASPDGESHESGGDRSPRSNVREQDRYLPIANISRIMKKALPANGKIAKDAKDTVQECVSEFISFVTSEYAIPKSKQLGYLQSLCFFFSFQISVFFFDKKLDLHSNPSFFFLFYQIFSRKFVLWFLSV